MGKFGDMIKNKRLEKRINLRKMAQLLEISPSYLSDLENGKRLPPNGDNDIYRNLLENISKLLEMTNQETEKLQLYADEELIGKGYVTKEMSEYLSVNQMAVTALRKAKNANADENTWKEIVRILEGSDD